MFKHEIKEESFQFNVTEMDACGHIFKCICTAELSKLHNRAEVYLLFYSC